MDVDTREYASSLRIYSVNNLLLTHLNIKFKSTTALKFIDFAR